MPRGEDLTQTGESDKILSRVMRILEAGTVSPTPALHPFTRNGNGNYAATTVILAGTREEVRFRMEISTSLSRAVRNVIKRSTEKPSSL